MLNAQNIADSYDRQFSFSRIVEKFVEEIQIKEAVTKEPTDNNSTQERTLFVCGAFMFKPDEIFFVIHFIKKLQN